jgi:hypothetical protein
LRKKVCPSASTDPELPDGDRSAQFAGDLIALPHDAIAAIAEIGDQDHRAAGAAFGVQRFQRVGIHSASLTQSLDIDLDATTAG